jgi:DNA-directed RNA polymerase specialized sigma24 family protein
VAGGAGLAPRRGEGVDLALSGGDQPCTDRLRARVRRAAPGLDDAPEPADGQPRRRGADDRGGPDGGVAGGAGRLPDRQREAVVLRHIEGLPNPEIAEILGVGVEAVESLTARGKRALAAALQRPPRGAGI